MQNLYLNLRLGSDCPEQRRTGRSQNYHPHFKLKGIHAFQNFEICVLHYEIMERLQGATPC